MTSPTQSDSPTAKRPDPVRKWGGAALKIGVTVGLFWLISRELDTDEIAARLRNADYLILLGATLLIFLQLASNSERWRRLMQLDGVILPYRNAFRFYLEGMFFNQALPGAVGGDVIRIYRVRPFCRGLGQAINGILLDRITGLIALCCLILVGLPLLLQRVGDSEPVIGFVAVMIAGLLGVGVVFAIARMNEEGVGGRIRGGIIRFARLFVRLIRHPSEALPVLMLGLITQVLVVVVAYASASGLGLAFSFLDCLIVVPASILIATLPISIGGWGVRETAMAAGFTMLGASGTDAVALSIVMGLQLVAVGLIGGLVWLLGGAVRPPETLEE